MALDMHTFRKEAFPHLNRAERKKLAREAARQAALAPDRVAGAYETFRDPVEFDMWCVRLVGSVDFSNTVHFVTRADAYVALDWLTGERADLPVAFLSTAHEQHARALLDHWRATLGSGMDAAPDA